MGKKKIKDIAKKLVSLKDEPKEGKLTACIECRHSEIGGRGNIWYHQYCKAKGRNKSFDPLYGKMVEGEYPHIREFNNGHCTMYDPKQSA